VSCRAYFLSSPSLICVWLRVCWGFCWIAVILLLWREPKWVLLGPNCGHTSWSISQQPGLALLTLFLSRVEVIKQSIASGTQDIAEVPSSKEAQQWYVIFCPLWHPNSSEKLCFNRSNMFNHLFDLLAPHMLILFPSSRIVQPSSSAAQSSGSRPSSSVVYDNADQHVWQFLAAFALHGSLEQHQALVTMLREKILDDLLAVSRGWFTTEQDRNTKLGNVNLFLNALGLDCSQISLPGLGMWWSLFFSFRCTTICVMHSSLDLHTFGWFIGLLLCGALHMLSLPVRWWLSTYFFISWATVL